MVCTLISGCGLFRKKTTTLNRQQIDLVEQSQSNVSLTGKLEGNKLMITQFDKTSSSEENTIIEADEINVDKDGNISAKGATLKQNKKSSESDNSHKKQFEETKADFSLQADSSGLNKGSTEKVQKETKTDASAKGILWGMVAVIVILFIIVLLVKR